MQFGNAPAGYRAAEPPSPPAVVRPGRFQSDPVVLRLVVRAIMETEPGLVWRHQVRLVADATDFLATGHACPAERARTPSPGLYVSIPNQLVDVEAQAVLDCGPATTPVPSRTRSAHFSVRIAATKYHGGSQPRRGRIQLLPSRNRKLSG